MCTTVFGCSRDVIQQYNTCTKYRYSYVCKLLDMVINMCVRTGKKVSIM